LAASCGGGTPTPVMPPIFDTVIVFGQRVGPVSLGMSEGQLQKAIGEPLNGTQYGSTRTGYIFNKLHLTVVVEGGIVVRVSPSDRSYAAPSGIRLDAPLAEAAAAPATKREHHGVASYCFPDHTLVTVRTAENAGASPECAVGTICDIALGGCVP
jgi:hypothetical protein